MIHIDSLNYRYPGSSIPALQDIHLTIPSTGCTALMGSNGSGKSTLARCLNGLLLPSSGDVLIDGMSVNDPLHRMSIRRRVGLLFQDPDSQLTSATVERELAFGLQNLAVPTEEMHRLIEEQMSRFRLRNGLTAELSGGEKQRLAIASVLLLKPGYLILDESTSLLPESSRREVLGIARALQLQVATILITQFPSEAESADRLIILHKGRVLLDDTPERVFAHTPLLAECGIPLPARFRWTFRQ